MMGEEHVSPADLPLAIAGLSCGVLLFAYGAWKRSKGSMFGGAALGLGSVLLFLLVSAAASSQREPNRKRCEANLRQIHLGIETYRKTSGDVLPPAGPALLDALRREAVTEESVYVCPSSGDDPESYASWKDMDMALPTDPAVARRLPLFWDRDGLFHGGHPFDPAERRNVLFADGHVEFLDDEAFRRIREVLAEELGLSPAEE